MTDQFQDVDLPGHALDVGHVDDLLLLEDLDGYLLSGGDVDGWFDFPEGAFAESLACDRAEVPIT